MNLLIVDYFGDALSMAVLAAQHGHDVKWFANKKPPSNGQGFKGVQRVHNWLNFTDWADMIVSAGDMMYVSQFDALRSLGYRVFGPSRESSALELNWVHGVQTFSKNGIAVPEFRAFKEPDKAVEYIASDGDQIIRVGGKSSVIKSTPESLENVRKSGFIIGDVVLQKHTIGTEITVGRFIGSAGWIGPWVEVINSGPMAPGGCVVATMNYSALGSRMLGPFESDLMAMNHTGFVAVRAIVDKGGNAFPLEWKCGFDWPMMCSIMGSNAADPVEWMKAAMYGFDITQFTLDVGVCVPVFMFGDQPKAVSGLSVGNRKHVYPVDAADIDCWKAVGSRPVVVTGHGANVTQATNRAKKTVGQIFIPDAIANLWVNERLESQLNHLHQSGFATDVKY